MKLQNLFFSWNIRGYGKAEKKRSIRRMISNERPKFILLQETKYSNLLDEVVRDLCGKFSSFDVKCIPPIGLSGGLCSIWNSEIFKCDFSVEVQGAIVCVGRLCKVNLRVGIINVYAPNDSIRRREFLEELRNWITANSIPVIIGGDFNIVRNKEESTGVSMKTKDMECFSDFINDQGLIDMPCSGGKYTWSSLRQVPSFSRLHHFLISTECAGLWTNLTQRVLPKGLSDHNPIVLSVDNVNWAKYFKWFDHWGEEKELVDLIRKTVSTTEEYGISKILRECKATTKVWVQELR
ncbi:hypothetical protein HRI_004109300 [Hibiscus trionum]|uniref:Endonuclease/exonuclease/phosphatase domain-containing protein n=1 Tax=Hibiscus trionum TaxID=183268 RepID=A0A9W7IXE3_HIBTR|nr:hypothetical protein HRI_004109300 [Hibiscus trionum]